MESTLGAITGIDPFWTEVKSVRRVPAVPTEFENEEKPGLLLVATGEAETIENQHSFRDRRTLKAGVIGVINRPRNDEGTVVNRFMKDVSIAVMADISRGGLASMTFKTRQLDASNLFNDLCIFEMEFEIIYFCDGREE